MSTNMSDDDPFQGKARKMWNPFKVELPEYNVLLLGETGAGKSTTINAFANYMRYESFDEAQANEFIQMITSSFTLPHPDTGEPTVIRSGEETANERPGSGSSSTQSPSAYLFKFKDRRLRIIDTPGMGDTGGATVDRENFDKILAHLHNYKQLHGILLLMKASETRKTTFFKYCITELLAHLHKSACKNLVFCFTFSRNSFYGPGEGFSTLNSLLSTELSEVKLNLEPGENCFFIDNEAYRFLVAKKQGYPFPMDQENSYRDSWNRSVQQSNAMWDRIIGTKPHNLYNTTSLNNARKLVLEMAEPMVMLQDSICANIIEIKRQEDQLRNSTENKEELARNLKLEVDDLEMKALEYPRTVCTTANCTEIINYQGQSKIHYKTECHAHCYLDDVSSNTVGHPTLKDCSAIDLKGKCHECKCDWQKHMHIRVEYVKVKRAIVDSNKQIEVNSTDDAIIKIENAIESMVKLVQEYEDEYKEIEKICTKFAYILISNSNTPYNRFIEPYLDHLIEQEEQLINAIPNYPLETRARLLKMKLTHRESVRILSEAISNNRQEDVKLEDIFLYKEQLFQLKHTGKQFQQMMKMANWTKQTDIENIPEKDLDLSKIIRKPKPTATGAASATTSNATRSEGNKKGFFAQFLPSLFQ